MIVTSIFSIAEEIKSLLGNRFIVQEFIAPVVDAYATAAKLNFYEGRQNELSDLDGSFLYTFKKLPILNDGQYYITIPSTYLVLPHQTGINYVSFDGSTQEFVMIGSTGWSFYSGIDASGMGGMQPYEINGDNMYFPNMTAADLTTLDNTTKTIKIKLAVALDTTNVRQQINISPVMKKQIIDIVVKDYSIKPAELPENLE